MQHSSTVIYSEPVPFGEYCWVITSVDPANGDTADFLYANETAAREAYRQLAGGAEKQE